MTAQVVNRDELTDAQQIAALVSQPSPATARTDLPVDVLLATAYALHPENLSVAVRKYLDDLSLKHSYFSEQVNKIREAKDYYINMETAE